MENCMNPTTLKRMAIGLALALVASLCVLMAAPQAFAATKTMKIGDNIFMDDCEVRSNNPSVVRCILGDNGVTILAVGFGKATVTVDDWGYIDDDGDEVINRKTYKITVKGGNYPKRMCDGLYDGTKYSMRNLVRSMVIESEDDEEEFCWSDADFTAYMSKHGGKFLKGKGYTVSGKGKYITFTKTGKVTVKYRYKGKTYKMHFKSVHSKSSTVSKLSKGVKSEALQPWSFYMTKASVVDKDCGAKIKMRFSVVNAYGQRVACTAYGWYQYGYFNYEW